MEKQTITQPEKWVVKDRTYLLIGKHSPVVLVIPSKHTRRKPLLYFDPELGYQRELRYATNQPSVFVDEQKGPATLGHVVMRDGKLTVPANQKNLQMFLSLYHPRLNTLYREFEPEVQAEYDVDWIELEIEALNLAKTLDVSECEAILRVNSGSKVSKMSSKEVKRDLLLYAKRNPGEFIKLAQDDDVQLRNMGIKAVEAKLITLSPDQRHFTWTKTKKKLCTVPFEEHPYSALAQWLKTDEGLEVLKSVEKRLNK
jgi:hypothetical protein